MMSKMRSVLILIFLFTYCIGNAQISLRQRISINAQNVSITEALSLIEQQQNFYFAYNPDLFSSEKKLSISEVNSPIKQVLDKILNKEYTYKPIGNHVILKYKQEDEKIEYVISGIVTNGNGNALDSVVVYAIKDNKAAITGHNGAFNIKLEKHPQYVSFCHPNFKDTLIVAENLKNGKTVSLQYEKRKKLDIKKIEMKKSTNVNTGSLFDDNALVKAWIPQSAKFVTKQVKIRQYNPIQLSVTPTVGTQMLVQGLKYNCLSLNMFVGYSKGVLGAELGTIANIIQEDVCGLQAVGFTNVVNGKTKGVQMAGCFNKTFGKVTGIQAAGIGNVAKDRIKGIQMGGICNYNKKEITGLQAAGITNVLSDNINGAQIAGIYNIAKNIKGVQLAGIANQTTANVHGVQMAFIANKTKILHGVQLGFLNVADSVESGVQIGLINIVKNGYRRYEFLSNETFLLDFMYKTGRKRFYSIINIGINTQELGLGYGIGIVQPLYKKFSGNIDWIETAMLSSELSDSFMGEKSTFRFALNYALKKHIELTGGVSVNFFMPNSAENADNFPDKISFCQNSSNIISESITNSENVAWSGWFIGLRF